MSNEHRIASITLAADRTVRTALAGAALLAGIATMAATTAAAAATPASCAFQGAVYRFDAAPGAAVATLSGVRDATPGHLERQPYTMDQIRGLLAVLEIGTQTRSKGFESAAANQPECLKQQARAALATLLNGRTPPAR